MDAHIEARAFLHSVGQWLGLRVGGGQDVFGPKMQAMSRVAENKTPHVGNGS